MRLLYEGKSKQIFSTDDPNEVLVCFKDSVTAQNGLKKDIYRDKGRVNSAFTRHFFSILEETGIKTHVVSYLDDTSIRAKHLRIFSLEIVVRNYAAGSICKRYNYEKGYRFETPLLEFFLKSDELCDPPITEEEIIERDLATIEEISFIKAQTLKVNEVLSKQVDKKGVILVDFKLEYGREASGQILLADEISPDSCRFWLKSTMESLDKDVYREDKGDLVDSYKKLMEILGVKHEI